ncbi:YkgJ family cysteine cluster protein [Helicobacter sp.]|uniref:YkgJ family cysteine cluster protein n=1 Tax=Helicobacter sp. TaxID=218 RepID=UPI0025C3C33F|nr:YkgJ family cysteine cluster protein [Helicobacter sp.]MCI5968424.1 YkgJ family cysteine cluster protein [Helicobacter sp.]MDY2585209.1 YkgJ family cysteine cluster protein [Helicobacter sp.]
MLEHSDFQYHFDPSKCKECGGKCCTGESGYVFVTPKEIEEIAEFLGLDFDTFCQNYVKKVGYRYSLLDITQDNKTYSCVFFKDGICQIYPKRPKQCVAFPFWDYYKEHFDELEKECIGVVKK